MFPALDHTHDPGLRSWLAAANGHVDFPMQNLPFGVFEPAGGGGARGGVAIGDAILDLRALVATGLLHGEAQRACVAASGPTLNPLLALGSGPRQALRQTLSGLLAEDAPPRPELLHPASACTMHLPATIGDYTDFYAGIHHARHVGELFRPDNPLLPNYKWVPIGYHGRASSVRVAGAAVRRPSGQRKLAEEAAPSFGPTRSLDYELELGMWIGPGNEPGVQIPIEEAAQHIAGYCLLNDWSARDLQAWEYQPLGPFLGKSFHTTISPWIITPEALAPFRWCPGARPEGDPKPLDYLRAAADEAHGGLNVELEVWLSTAKMGAGGLAAQRLSSGNTHDLYWTPQQMVAHHASNGCNLRPGDLLGSGTISSETPEGLGCLLERTRGGRDPLTLVSGETRCYLEDGDEVILRAYARREGFQTIGFGDCRGVVTQSQIAML